MVLSLVLSLTTAPNGIGSVSFRDLRVYYRTLLAINSLYIADRVFETMTHYRKRSQCGSINHIFGFPSTAEIAVADE